MQVTVRWLCSSHTLPGSGYLTGNRRLHFYFFSTNSFIKGIALVDDVEEYRKQVRELNNPELGANARAWMENELLGMLNVYDALGDAKDAFHK